MRSFRRATQRVAFAVTAVASVALFATCNLDKITSTPPEGGVQIPNFHITGDGDTVINLGGLRYLGVDAGSADLTHTTQVWTSSNPAVATVGASDGLVQGVALGVATITVRLLAPELDTGVTASRQIRVRYKGIKVAKIDSIAGLNLSRAVVVNGTNDADAVVSPAISSGLALSTHDSGSTSSTVGQLIGQAVYGRKPGRAYLIAAFEDMKDSLIYRVRQVAKSITFAATPYVANAVCTGTCPNGRRVIPLTVKDVNDSVIASPTLTWRSSDTTMIAIDSVTGSMRVKTVTPTATITVRSDTVVKTQTVQVAQVVGTLIKFAGDAQTDTVGATLAINPAVTANDSGGTVVSGATVTFAPGTNSGSVTGGTQTTAANGRATVGSWTLGTTTGTQTLVATSGSGTATFTATVTAGSPAGLVFEVQPASVTTNVAIAPAVKVRIVDASGNLVTTATNSVTLAIGVNPGSATLGGTKTVAAVAGVATFSTLTLNTTGTGYTLVATSGTLNGATSNSFNVFGLPAKLGFLQQPTSTVVSRAIAPAVTVAVQDAAGNTVTNSTASITLSLSTNPGVATFGGTLTANAVAGVATFSNLTVNQVANGYQITATATSLTSIASSLFNVIAVGPAARLSFITEPTNTVATQPINASTTPAGIRVAVVDSGGATVTSSSQQIALSILANPGSGSLSGTTSATASGGIATFTGLSLNKVGTAYTLLATATGSTLGSDTSATFNVTVGAATKLGYLVQPSNINTGGTMSPAVQVAVQDAGGNTVAGTTHTITLTPSNGSFTGGNPTTAVTNGVATFSSLTYTNTPGSYTVSATAAGSPTLTSATSNTFQVTAAGQPIRLRFAVDPTNATAGTAISPSIQVEAVDGSNTRTTSAGGSVTLSIGTNAGGGALSGTQTVALTSGVASFTNISINLVGTGYTLVATHSGILNSATSAAFNITAGAASKVGFVAQPSNVVAGAAIAPAVTVAVQDAQGNTVPSATNNVQMFIGTNPGGSILSGATTVAAVNGIATFSNLRLDRVGTGYTLFAQFLGGGGGAASAQFNVIVGPASKLTFKTQPSNASAGATITPAVQVQVSDDAGNVITSSTDAITLVIASGPSGATLNGTATVNAVAGVATFSNLSINKSSVGSGTSYTLGASAANLASANSNQFAISAAAAAKLKWNVVPASTVKNATLLSSGGQNLEVQVLDAFDNQVFSNSPTYPITIGFGVNPGGATLTGTNPVTTNFGSAFFSDLKVTAAGAGYTLVASSTGLTSATTPAFDVAAFGTAFKTTFVQGSGPVSSQVGAAMPAIKVAIVDNAGNVVTSGASSTQTVFLFFANGGNPSGGTVYGNQIAAVAGVATFSNTSIDKVATGYILASGTATMGGDVSSSFDVTSGATQLTTGAGVPSDVVVNGGNIYWSEASAIRKASTASAGAATTLVPSSISNASAITTDGTSVYWVDGATGGSIRKVGVAGGGTVDLITGLGSVGPRIEVDASFVYFMSQVSGVWKLRRIDKAAVNGAPPATTLYTVNAPVTTDESPFALSGSTLFFSNGSTVLSGPSAGGSPTTLVGSESGQSFAVSGATVYYTMGTNLRSVSTSGTGFNSSFPTLPFSGGKLVSDGTNVYLAHNTAGAFRVAAAGGAGIPLYMFSSGAMPGIALDGANQYWVNTVSGTSAAVIKAPK